MIVDEIEIARRSLGLTEREFFRLPERHATALCEAVEARFVARDDVGRWWQRLVKEPARASFRDGHAHERIASLVPDVHARVYFVPEAEGATTPAAYYCTVDAALRVLAECYAFEYYLVPKDLAWLVCENNHGVLLAVGEPVRTRLVGLSHPSPAVPRLGWLQPWVS